MSNEPQPHVNPPLAALNAAAREADAVNRDVVNDALNEAHVVMQRALAGKGGRRGLKPLTPPSKGAME